MLNIVQVKPNAASASPPEVGITDTHSHTAHNAKNTQLQNESTDQTPQTSHPVKPGSSKSSSLTVPAMSKPNSSRDRKVLKEDWPAADEHDFLRKTKQLESGNHFHPSPSGSPPIDPRSRSWIRFYEPSNVHFRFYILALATLVPFGGHVIKYSISSLQPEMLADESFGLDHTEMGLLQSAVSMPNLVMPLLGGLFLDKEGNARGTIFMLCICFLGHLGFVISCMYKDFQWALASRILFGLGQGSTVVAQGRICATWFVGREIVFAIALTESTHNLANFIAFVYVVPMSEWLGGYIYSLWMGLGFCLMSLIAGILFFQTNHETDPSMEQIDIENEDQDPQHLHHPHPRIHAPYQRSPAMFEPHETSSLISDSTSPPEGNSSRYQTFGESPKPPPELAINDDDEVTMSPLSSTGSTGNSLESLQGKRYGFCPCDGLSLGFFILCMVHMTYSNCFHLFSYISASLIHDRFHTSVSEAGWMAGLSSGIAIFLCPIAGFFLDWFGYKIWILAACGCTSALAYLFLFQAQMSPIPSLIMLAVCISFTPTIMKSSVPNLVLPAVYGVAYGIYEISESLGSVIGNAAVGFVRDKTTSWDLDLEIFIVMSMIATSLTLLLIVMDHSECIGMGTHGKPLGALNQSSFKMGETYDRLKRKKDRHFVRQASARTLRRQQGLNEEPKRPLAHV